MYVWKERDTRTLCAPETKSKAPEKSKKAGFLRLLPGGGVTAVGSAFPVNRYGVFLFLENTPYFFYFTIP